MNQYDAVWWNEFVDPPAYELIDFVQGETPEEALRKSLRRLTRKIRELYGILPDWPSNDKIHRSLYVIRSKGLVCAYDLTKKERNAERKQHARQHKAKRSV